MNFLSIIICVNTVSDSCNMLYARRGYNVPLYFVIAHICIHINSPLTQSCNTSEAYYSQDTSLHAQYNYSQFQPFEKIEKELHRIANDKTSISRTLFSLGKTFEGRKLWAIKFHKDDDSDDKKTIVVDCGAHAREWLAPSTCMYLIQQFAKVNGDDLTNNLTAVMIAYDWVIIPLLNPDGYVYTWHNRSTRLWRKNRSYTTEQLKLRTERQNELCIGVDINRNFDAAWGGAGAPVNNPCYEMYAGQAPFSERESTALAGYLNSTKENVIAYVTLHCFGQAWMTPYGHTKKKPKEYKEMVRVAQLATAAMKRLSGVTYSVGTSYKELYPHSGSSIDWAHDKLKILYSYNIEMIPKDGEKTAFMLSPSCMIKNTRDILEGIRTMANALVNVNKSEGVEVEHIS